MVFQPRMQVYGTTTGWKACDTLSKLKKIPGKTTLNKNRLHLYILCCLFILLHLIPFKMTWFFFWFNSHAQLSCLIFFFFLVSLFKQSKRDCALAHRKTGRNKKVSILSMVYSGDYLVPTNLLSFFSCCLHVLLLFICLKIWLWNKFLCTFICKKYSRSYIHTVCGVNVCKI